MEIKKDFKNELLKRQELVIVVEAEKNPSFDEIRKKISEKFSKPEEVIDVCNIKGSFGSKEFTIEAHIYESKDELAKIINMRKSKKQKEKDAKAKEDAEKQKTAQAPTEEKSEEKQEPAPAQAENKQEEKPAE